MVGNVGMYNNEICNTCHNGHANEAFCLGMQG